MLPRLEMIAHSTYDVSFNNTDAVSSTSATQLTCFRFLFFKNISFTDLTLDLIRSMTTSNSNLV